MVDIHGGQARAAPPEEIVMTNENRKTEIRRRMAETGETYSEARNQILAQHRGRANSTPRKVCVAYTFTRHGSVDIDADEWANALPGERQHMIEAAFAEELDGEFDLYGAEGIAQCVDEGELAFDWVTQEERDAEYVNEVVAGAILDYAGIEEHQEWPDGVARPLASDSYLTQHEGEDYIVLRRGRTILAVVHVDKDGHHTRLKVWPKQVERW